MECECVFSNRKRNQTAPRCRMWNEWRIRADTKEYDLHQSHRLWSWRSRADSEARVRCGVRFGIVLLRTGAVALCRDCV